METRKVQLSGGTTYTVSLPKSWATEHRIDAGSTLRLHPKGNGSLLVESMGNGGGDERTASVDSSGLDGEGLARTIHALYVVGVDRIRLVDETTHSTERRSAITRLAGRLSGLEVLEASDTAVTLRSLLDAGSVSIRKSVLRLKLVTLGMHRDAVRAFVSGDRSLAEAVIERDDEADRLFAMVTRYFRRSLSNLAVIDELDLSRDELFEYYYVARQFERIADHAEKIARLAGEDQSDDLGDALASHADRARTIADHAADVALSNAHVEMAYDATADRDELVEELDAFGHELHDRDEPGEIHRVSLLLDSIERTAEYGANVAEMAVQRTARRNELPEV
ncbi:phosphate signaling complex PhoU family protein [Halococcus agarilyticus]|uniref:phosphate signaling complex PhoU family protein n=1 Tax=Halococcus agarilyticus TaxID=1232219 RepID=UPI00067765A6|nr:phosphate uptake regulator PhoU [Halococcus agarilyticus]